MVTSIRIKDQVISGLVPITADSNISISSDDNIMSIRRYSMEEDPRLEYLAKLLESGEAPYVSKISGVSPDTWGNVWMLGGKTSQVDINNSNTILLSDMAQTVDFPHIYSNVYAMLRQIRLWIDAHKDNLLLSDTTANDMWDHMQDTADGANDNWRPPVNPVADDKTITMFTESRLRSEIPSLGTAINMLNEYLGVVALWNYIVGTPKASVDVRLHPADQAGIYVGANIVVPIVEKKNTTIRVEISASFEGQTGENLYMWNRMPVCRIVPGGASIKPAISLSGDTGIKDTSILDKGHQKQGSAITGTATFEIPVKAIHTAHTVQCVLEAIPFYLCDDEVTYADSKKATHYYSIGENKWTVTIKIYRDGSVINEYRSTKNTAYAAVCEPDESSSSDN